MDRLQVMFSRTVETNYRSKLQKTITTTPKEMLKLYLAVDALLLIYTVKLLATIGEGEGSREERGREGGKKG